MVGQGLPEAAERQGRLRYRVYGYADNYKPDANSKGRDPPGERDLMLCAQSEPDGHNPKDACGVGPSPCYPDYHDAQRQREQASTQDIGPLSHSATLDGEASGLNGSQSAPAAKPGLFHGDRHEAAEH